MDFLNADGLLGTRASLMMDLVVLAMAVFLPVLGWSIFQVKYRRRYALHKRVQIGLGIVLAVTLVLFESHLRLHGWQQRAATTAQPTISASVWTLLGVHLVCSICTAVLWVFVITQALRKIPDPPGPCAYSSRHRRWGRAAAVGMVLTTLTGWAFYWGAFVD